MNSIEALMALSAYLLFVAVLSQTIIVGGEINSTKSELRMACAVLDYAATMKGVSFELPENDFSVSDNSLYLNGESKKCLHSISLSHGLVVNDE